MVQDNLCWLYCLCSLGYPQYSQCSDIASDATANTFRVVAEKQTERVELIRRSPHTQKPEDGLCSYFVTEVSATREGSWSGLAKAVVRQCGLR